MNGAQLPGRSGVRIRTVAGVAAGVGSALVMAPGLYLAQRLHREGFDPSLDRQPDPLDLQVTSVSDQTVTLRTAAKAPATAPTAPGTYLVEGARGWGYAGRVIESNAILAVREFRPGGGDLRAGDYARLDGFAFPGDPFQSHGYTFEDVQFESPLGAFDAWYVPGANRTWAILVHGKGASRREALRILPALLDAGFHCLAITYRNDADQPAAPRGQYSYGRDEWEDLDAAIAYALGHGANDIVLVGFSMGGAVALGAMAKSSHAARVSALILDSPMTNLTETVAHGARQAHLPVPFLAFSNRLAARMYRFRWADFDYTETVQKLDVPVLLFHGDVDETIPVELSDRVAELRPDIVTYVRVPGAAHVRSWNVDPEAYLSAVREFVTTRRPVSS